MELLRFQMLCLLWTVLPSRSRFESGKRAEEMAGHIPMGLLVSR